MNPSLNETLNYWLQQLIQVGRFAAQHKDFFDALQSIVTAFGIPIAAIWALRRFSLERPFEPALVLDIGASATKVNPVANLLHIEIYCENIGRAAFVHLDPATAQYRCWVRVYELNQNSDTANAANEWFDWENPKFSTMLFDGWFADAPHLVIESGEKERFAADLIIPSSTSVISIWIKIFEAQIKDKRIGRPYFWSTSRVFNVSGLLSKSS